ncbi:MAG: RNA-protein complex protein Nop10 [Candidatus Bathyarchaeia archaeon]
MKWQIRRCVRCSRYTLKEKCPDCDGETVVAHPPKFSPTDKYARLRQPADAGLGT